MKFLATLISIFLSIQMRADAIYEISKIFELPYVSYGIVLDNVKRDSHTLTYDCHIDYDSKTITSFLEAYSNTELADSIKKMLSDHYDFYNPLGKGINTQEIHMFGETLFGQDCPVYLFFKADMINSISQYISTYKLEKELRCSKSKI